MMAPSTLRPPLTWRRAALAWSRRLLLWGAAAVALAAPDPFQAARPLTRFSDSRAGLPADTVHALLLDRQGTLWAGTVDGPARHTERGWEPFPLPGGSRSSFVRTVLEDRSGALWFGTQDGGLWRWRAGAWTHFEGGRDLPSNRVNCLLETTGPGGAPEVWAGTSRGVAHFAGGRWLPPDPSQGGLSDMIWKLREVRERDGSTSLWAAGHTGMFALRSGVWQRVGKDLPALRRGASDILQVPTTGGPLEVWVACWGYGLARWDGAAWSLYPAPTHFPSPFPTSLALGDGPDGKPAVWAGTFDASLAWFGAGAWHTLNHGELGPTSGIYALKSLPGTRPDFILGTRGSGVGFLDLGGWRILDERCGLPSAEVNTFAETGEGFWIGTARGLVRWGKDGPRPERVRPDLANVFVSTLLATREAGRERLWTGTLRGLFVRENGQWRAETPLPVLRAMVHALVETPAPDGGTRLWAATGNGVACREHGQWRQVLPRPGEPEFTALSLAVSGGRPDDPAVWVGTGGRGLLRLQGDSLTLNVGGGSLPNPSLYGLVASTGPGGRTWLWAATPGGGIGRLETGAADPRWEMFTTTNTPGLPTPFISGLFKDREGRLYALTTRGIARITLGTRDGLPVPTQLETFTTGDGLPTNTLAANTGFQDRAGRIWVGTAKGAAVLDPSLERPSAPLQTPALTRILVDNRAWTGDGPLVFPHGVRRLVLEFRVSALHRLEDVRYRTWIRGLEGEAAPWQAEPRRELTGLPAGRYELQVTARNHAGQETEALRIPFRVLPAPWATPWAFGAYALAALGLGLAVVRWRTRWLTAHNEALRNEMRTLEGLIPVCSYCKKIRNDSGSWDEMEHFLARRSGASFSHGVCPECRDQVRSEFRKD